MRYLADLGTNFSTNRLLEYALEPVYQGVVVQKEMDELHRAATVVILCPSAV